MSYIEDIFQRVDVRQIRSFLLYGEGLFDTDHTPHEERLEKQNAIVSQLLRRGFPDKKDFYEAEYAFNAAMSVYSEVYMELGLLAGAKLQRTMESEREAR